jgi:hypothetical protein
MSRTQLFVIPAERRERARRQLTLLASRRVSPASVLALVDAATDAMAEGRVGAACDVLGAVCSPPRAQRILVELLVGEPGAGLIVGREAVR